MHASGIVRASLLPMRLIADLRFALRQFRKSPVFTITILAVLALGVGATTSIFGLFDQILLRSLPVMGPGELVRVQGHSDYFSGSLSMLGGDQDEYMSYPPTAMCETTPAASSAAYLPRARSIPSAFSGTGRPGWPMPSW